MTVKVLRLFAPGTERPLKEAVKIASATAEHRQGTDLQSTGGKN